MGFTFCPSFSAFPPPSWFIKEASSPQSLELIQSGGLGWLWDGGKRQRAAGVNPSLFCCPAVELLSVKSGSETHREFAYGANMSWKRARSGESPISRRAKGRRETSVARWGWAGQCCSHGATAHRHLAGFMTEALMNFFSQLFVWSWGICWSGQILWTVGVFGCEPIKIISSQPFQTSRSRCRRVLPPRPCLRIMCSAPERCYSLVAINPHLCIMCLVYS